MRHPVTLIVTAEVAAGNGGSDGRESRPLKPLRPLRPLKRPSCPPSSRGLSSCPCPYTPIPPLYRQTTTRKR